MTVPHTELIVTATETIAASVTEQTVQLMLITGVQVTEQTVPVPAMAAEHTDTTAEAGEPIV